MKKIEKALKDSGLKLTKARLELIKALQKGHHMTAKEIHEHMPSSNVASIYNNLFEFEQIGIVFSLKGESGVVYELIHGEDHHDKDFHAHVIDQNQVIHDLDCADVMEYIKKKYSKKYNIKSIKIEITE